MENTPTANEKRKASCAAVGGAKKRAGHGHETRFLAQFGPPGETTLTYKAEADAVFSPLSPNYAALEAALKPVFGDLSGLGTACSLKSGKSIQFTLGKIPEVQTLELDSQKAAALSGRILYEKYLGKSGSAVPATWLVYADAAGDWTFFQMSDVLDYLAANLVWRNTKKGDPSKPLRKGTFYGEIGGAVFLTYEHRGGKHKSTFLGVNGGRGLRFIELLRGALKCARVLASK